MSAESTGRKVLITGASGVLGRSVCRRFLQSGWKILGLAFSRANGENLIRCDLSNFAEVETVIENFQPDAIVHCAAERKPDGFEKDPEKSMFLNVEVTKNLATISEKRNIFFILISTDYVFDGTKPPYKETDEPNPLQAYGLSKSRAEKATLDVSPKHVILRVPLLYGEVENLDENAVTILLKNILNTKTPVRMDDIQTRYPTYIGDVAEVCYRLCSRRLDENCEQIHGIVHFSGLEKFTKYDIAILIGSLLNLPIEHIERDRSPAVGAVQRPNNAQLDTSKLEKDFGIPIERVQFGATIRKCLERFL